MEYLASKHRFHRLSIVAHIKDEAHRLVGRSFTDQEKDTPHSHLGGKTPRELYIYVGNLDEFNHPLWVQRMLRAGYQGPDELHIIESVGKQHQFTEVVRFCERAGDGVVILDVSRPDHTYKDNRSEIKDSMPHLVLSNDGDLEKVYGELDGLMTNWQQIVHKRTANHVSLAEAIEKNVYDG